ncbi:MAG: tetratricopeptide repeat protein [Deltaproteobacteria bacterium]|jgi:type IV pilus biogenesis/stability protein PilW|nr:tetratricopeptide repeat protein [Deltaproteobacteria bacterium]
MGRHLLLNLGLIVVVMVGLTGCSGGQTRRATTASTKQQLDAYVNLGRILLVQNDLAGALTELSKAEQLAPNNIDVLNYIGLTYYSRKDYDKAIDYYKRALAVDPGKTEIHNNLGLVYMDMKQFDLAKVQFEICLNDPTYARPWLPQFNMGTVEQLQGNTKKAEDIYRQILAISPQYSPTYYRLGQLLFERGQTQEAVDYLVNAVRLDPSYADAFFLLAQGYEKLGKKDEAAEAYGQVVVLSPNTPRSIDAQRRARRVLGFE